MFMCFSCNSYCTNYSNNKTCKQFPNVEIDDMSVPYIREFNRKGYYTEFCCSGHTEEDSLYTYVSFKSGPASDIIPIVKAASKYIGDELRVEIFSSTHPGNLGFGTIPDTEIKNLNPYDIISVGIYPSREVMDEYENCTSEEDRWILIARTNARLFQLACSLPPRSRIH